MLFAASSRASFDFTSRGRFAWGGAASSTKPSASRRAAHALCAAAARQYAAARSARSASCWAATSAASSARRRCHSGGPSPAPASGAIHAADVQGGHRQAVHVGRSCRIVSHQGARDGKRGAHVGEGVVSIGHRDTQARRGLGQLRGRRTAGAAARRAPAARGGLPCCAGGRGAGRARRSPWSGSALAAGSPCQSSTRPVVSITATASTSARSPNPVVSTSITSTSGRSTAAGEARRPRWGHD